MYVHFGPEHPEKQLANAQWGFDGAPQEHPPQRGVVLGLVLHHLGELQEDFGQARVVQPVQLAHRKLTDNRVAVPEGA